MAKTELFPAVEGLNMSAHSDIFSEADMLQDIMDINGQKYLMLMLSAISLKQEYLTMKQQHHSGKISLKKEEQKNQLNSI